MTKKRVAKTLKTDKIMTNIEDDHYSEYYVPPEARAKSKPNQLDKLCRSGLVLTAHALAKKLLSGPDLPVLTEVVDYPFGYFNYFNMIEQTVYTDEFKIATSKSQCCSECTEHRAIVFK